MQVVVNSLGMAALSGENLESRNSLRGLFLAQINSLARYNYDTKRNSWHNLNRRQAP